MLTKGFLYVVNGSPKGRRIIFRWLFEHLARKHQHLVNWTLMNYGYADGPGSGHTVVLDSHADRERYCLQLYHRVVDGLSLAGKDVVEVSCGRGGGSAFLRRHFNARTVTGIDIANSAIEFCRRVHRAPGLCFLQGDAERLPLSDESVDAIVNVEASFCYEDINRFFSEVTRVLRPGGYFLYTDLRHVEEMDDLNAALLRCELDLLKMEDITANVVRALRLDAARRSAVAQMNLFRLFRHCMRTFAGAPGTRIPEQLTDGRLRYFTCMLRKPDASDSVEAYVA